MQHRKYAQDLLAIRTVSGVDHEICIGGPVHDDFADGSGGRVAADTSGHQASAAISVRQLFH